MPISVAFGGGNKSCSRAGPVRRLHIDHFAGPAKRSNTFFRFSADNPL
jgi:hypothetical protein